MNTKFMLRLVLALNVLVALVLGILSATPGTTRYPVFYSLYPSLDTMWALPRWLAFLIVILLCVWRVFRFPEQRKLNWIGAPAFVLLGLLVSLVVVYGESCCDTPVNILAGFPLSWLHGITQAQNRLPAPLMDDLPGHLGTIHWYLDGWGLLADILVWFSLYLAVNFSVHEARWVS
jgi:hypothetical protein